MMELMRELSLAPGVSGSEEEIAKIITRELENVADKIEKDSMVKELVKNIVFYDIQVKN